ncbi:MAG: protoheme IX farnesyltransferase [Micavibrio aeruginosavorus]|uniref:Protoheme IX farnesyltransferase n=1 Tax=Micavibrio aeruginosavorus TaxID=349221 RepID=A0A2W5FM36_9BACT|nr:MAG: protoheme IX farnesyltransferase [Micavibrio aeruginosavorus]
MLKEAMETSEITVTTDSKVRDFYALLKPKVMSLVVFIGFAGYWIAPGREELHPFLAAVGIFALALGAGASGAFNMWFERDIDILMNRTKNRPLPLGKIMPDDALGFSIIMTIIAVMLMGMTTNWMAAGILAFASFFYVIIYTVWLKRITPQNIVIGGAAGAFPPMVGWAMVTGDISLASVILFLIVFLWTPPHFWALALFANEDYKRANIPMMPVVVGDKKTKIQMLVYTLILFPVAVAPYFLGFAGWIYGISSTALGLFFIYTSIKVIKDETLKSAKLMFGFSVFYLFAIFLALMMDYK